VPSSWASERIVNAAIPFSSAITIALRKYPRSAQWGTFICALVSVLSYLCSRICALVSVLSIAAFVISPPDTSIPLLCTIRHRTKYSDTSQRHSLDQE
jgi:hypothetical protein